MMTKRMQFSTPEYVCKINIANKWIDGTCMLEVGRGNAQWRFIVLNKKMVKTGVLPIDSQKIQVFKKVFPSWSMADFANFY